MEVPLYRISLFYDQQHPCWYSGRWHSVSCNNVSVQHFQGQKAKVRLWMVCVINHSFAWAKHKQSSVAAGLRLEYTSSLESWVLAKAAGRGWSSNPSPRPIQGLDTVEDSVLSHQNATESEKVESPHVAMTERIRQTPVVQSQCSVGASCWIIKLSTARASRLWKNVTRRRWRRNKRRIYYLKDAVIGGLFVCSWLKADNVLFKLSRHTALK